VITAEVFLEPWRLAKYREHRRRHCAFERRSAHRLHPPCTRKLDHLTPGLGFIAREPVFTEPSTHGLGGRVHIRH
jgi:hypothetical protein